MRWLGVDLGTKRVGLSCSEDDEGPAFALRTVTVKEGGEAEAVVEAAREVRAERLVLGLPLEMSGREGLAAKRVRGVARRIEALLPSAVIVWIDERLTSSEAHRQLAASGKREKDRKGSVDQLAAKILLDTALAIEARKRMGTR